jgi:hypothetical protein
MLPAASVLPGRPAPVVVSRTERNAVPVADPSFADRLVAESQQLAELFGAHLRHPILTGSDR